MACCGSAKAKDQLKAGWLKFFMITALFGGGGIFSITCLTVARGFRWFSLYWRILAFFLTLPYRWLAGQDRKQIASLPMLFLFWSFLVVYGFAGLVLLYGAGAVFLTSWERARNFRLTFFPALKRLFREMLEDAYVIKPELKCIVSGKLFSLSPAFSGFVFKYFNLFLIFGTLGLMGLLAGTVIKLAG